MTPKQIQEMQIALERGRIIKGVPKSQLPKVLKMSPATYYRKMYSGAWSTQDINVLSKYYNINLWEVIANAFV